MALIAVVAEPSGSVRIFFDLGVTRPAQEDARRIETAIAQAQDTVEPHLPRAA
jgi:hypothetical protein